MDFPPPSPDANRLGAQQKVIHATIKKVGEDIEALSFNTAIAQMMIFVNAFTNGSRPPSRLCAHLLVLLNPFAPHLTSELWETLKGNSGSMPAEITNQYWPDYNDDFLSKTKWKSPCK